MDLLIGEVALTFVEPFQLTYLNKEGNETTQQGVMAMAVSAQPKFTIRRCSTFHWARGDFEMDGTEYAIMHSEIDKLVHLGCNKLLDGLGQRE